MLRRKNDQSTPIASTEERLAETREIKARLRNAAEEIARVQAEAQASVNNLDRVKEMVSTDFLAEVMNRQEQLEASLTQQQGAAQQAAQLAQAAEQKLLEEQDRLAKLFEAYQTLEAEKEQAAMDLPLLQERLADREKLLASMKEDLRNFEYHHHRSKQYDEMKEQYEAIEGERNKLRQSLRQEQDQAAALLQETATLKENAIDPGYLQELEAKLEEERERLGKMLKVYEDVESEKDQLASKVAAWEEWYQRLHGTAGSAPIN